MHAQGRRTEVGSRGVFMEAEVKIGATALADRHLFAISSTVPADFQATSFLAPARILRLAG